MDEALQQLNDLTRWLGGQRSAAVFLRRPHRQVWGWLAGEHELQTASRARIADAWERVRRVTERVGEDPAAVARALAGPSGARATLYALPAAAPAPPAAVAEAEAEYAEAEPAGYFVPIEDYGARHAAGALARLRPPFAVP